MYSYFRFLSNLNTAAHILPFYKEPQGRLVRRGAIGTCIYLTVGASRWGLWVHYLMADLSPTCGLSVLTALATPTGMLSSF